MRRLPSLFIALAAVVICAAQAPARPSKQSLSPSATTNTAKSATASPQADLPLIEKPAASAKTIKYNDKDVIKLKTRLRYTTLIVLPKEEQILDFACGDRDFWVINGSHNFAYIKPAKQGAQTNLNLVTARGNIYSFVLSEVSEDVNAEADLKVFIELSDQAALATGGMGSTLRFVSIEQLEAVKAQLAEALETIRDLQTKTKDDVAKAKATFIKNVRFSYRFDAGKKPFNVRAIYNDDKFTYIQARPEETPTIYEIKDDRPNLIEFAYRDGQYVVNKIIDEGYLAIGKKRLSFKREE